MKIKQSEVFSPIAITLETKIEAVAARRLLRFLIAANWLIPKKPTEYRICIQDAGGDYMCEVYK
jgi:hypothetical protein